MKLKHLPWKPALIAAAFFALVWAILEPVYQRAIDSYGRKYDSCQWNLKQIGLGYQLYAQDYNEKFPPVSAGHQGWADILQPYLKSRPLFRCPTVDISRSGFDSTDYFYNANLAGHSQGYIRTASSTILNGDGIADAGTNASILELPFDWKRDGGPAQRHLDGANYSFADGHVKWVRPIHISTAPSKECLYTFSVK